jgi:hypothetical protein
MLSSPQQGKPERNLWHALDLMECRIVDGAPVGIYSVTGTLLREYHDFCETEVPASDRTVILHQVMIQSRESDVPFSKKDLVFAAEYQLTEARLIGRSFILSLKPGRAGWPEPGILASVAMSARIIPNSSACWKGSATRRHWRNTPGIRRSISSRPGTILSAKKLQNISIWITGRPL